MKKKVYPNWVDKYRGNGRTVKKVGNKYYLYKTTSKRIKGKDYPITNSTYIGIITEEGLVKTYNKVMNTNNINNDVVKLLPDHKLRIFVSSNIDSDDVHEGYNTLRKKTKEYLENTGLFEVYVFEELGASTMSAQDHYIMHLDDCDVCIFFILNGDEIKGGTRKEIERALKNNTKSLFYFCDEFSKEKTDIQELVSKPYMCKSFNVHKFDTLFENSSKDLMNDIFEIYHFYCKGQYISSENGQDLSNLYKTFDEGIDREYFKNIDKSVSYFLNKMFNYKNSWEKKEESSKLDEFTLEFLKIVLKEKRISDFDIKGYLSLLKPIQDKSIHEVIKLRWKAIEQYFNGNLEDCCKYLTKALTKAKKGGLPSWMIQEILIDKRNRNAELSIANNKWSFGGKEQEQLDSRNETYYFPIQDRLNNSLKEKQLNDLYKQTLRSPYTINLGNNYSDCGNILISLLMVGMYYGSITSILSINFKIKELLYYFYEKYEDSNYLKQSLIRLINNNDLKEIKQFMDRYPKILYQFSDDEIEMIMNLYLYEPIPYKRTEQLFISLGIFGYYLRDTSFKKYEKIEYEYIKNWISDDNHNIEEANYFFKSLDMMADRYNQNFLCDICNKFIENNCSRFYDDMFKMLNHNLDMDKVNKTNRRKFINNIVKLIENKDITYLNSIESIIIYLRKKYKDDTKQLESTIKRNYPDFYNETYSINVYDDSTKDIEYINKTIDSIMVRNEEQGSNGRYSYGINHTLTLYRLIKQNNLTLDGDLIKEIIKVNKETIMKSKQDIRTKIYSVLNLCFIYHRYPDVYKKNKRFYKDILSGDYDSYLDKNYDIFTNTNKTGFFYCLEFLRLLVEKKASIEINILLSNIKDTDEATILSIGDFMISNMLETEDFDIYTDIKDMILNKCLAWQQINYDKIQGYAVLIFMFLSNFDDLKDYINEEMIYITKNATMLTKKIILNNINKNINLNKETQDKIIEICAEDNNYIIRSRALNINK